MDKDPVSPITPVVEVPAPALTAEEDLQARYSQLEVEKNDYRNAFLKEKAKNKEALPDMSEDDRLKTIVDERLAESHLAEIAREQSIIIDKALKENKELKLTNLNKNNTPPASPGSSSEPVTPVRTTSITPEQLAYFKAKNWSEKDIERYKKNLGARV